MLARGELHTIGATTLDEYREHIEKDAALERRFQPVYVDQPTVEQTISILRGLRERDPARAARVGSREKELADLEEETGAMKQRWEAEKAAIAAIGATKAEIE